MDDAHGKPPLTLDDADRILLEEALRSYEADLVRLMSYAKPGIRIADTTIDADLHRCRALLRRVEGAPAGNLPDAVPGDAAR